MTDQQKPSDQLPEDAPPEQVPDDVPGAEEGAARRSARRAARGERPVPDDEDADEEEAADPPRSAGGRAETRWERQEIDAAAAEAGRIGGTVADDAADPAQRPLEEAGEGVAEGFEEAERELIEHATHGDQQAAHAVYHDRGRDEEAHAADQVAGEGDEERSTARERDDPGGRDRG